MNWQNYFFSKHLGQEIKYLHENLGCSSNGFKKLTRPSTYVYKRYILYIKYILVIMIVNYNLDFFCFLMWCKLLYMYLLFKILNEIIFYQTDHSVLHCILHPPGSLLDSLPPDILHYSARGETQVANS